MSIDKSTTNPTKNDGTFDSSDMQIIEYTIEIVVCFVWNLCLRLIKTWEKLSNISISIY